MKSMETVYRVRASITRCPPSASVRRIVLSVVLSVLFLFEDSLRVCVYRTVLVPYRYMYVDLLSVSLLFDRMSVSVDRRLVSVCDRVE